MNEQTKLLSFSDNNSDLLSDPIPGEIIAYVDGEPVYAVDDPEEMAAEELPEDEAFLNELTEEEKAEIQQLFDELSAFQL